MADSTAKPKTLPELPSPVVTGFIGGGLFFVLAALLLKALLLDGSGEWGKAGTFGDTLGGISNFITMLVVCVSAVYATREVRRSRQQHTAEVRAEAARHVFRASHALGRDALGLLDSTSKASIRRQLVEMFGDEGDRLLRTFRDAEADLVLFFPDAAIAKVSRLGPLWIRALALAKQSDANLDEVDEVRTEVIAGLVELRAELVEFAVLK